MRRKDKKPGAGVILKSNFILHLGKFYPPHSGGMESHVRDLAVRQTRTMSVSAIVANSARKNEKAVIDDVKVIRVARMGTIASMPVCLGLTNAIRQCPADLVHIHMPNPGAAFAFLRSGHRGKLIVTHHADTLGRKALRHLSDPYVRQVMERASAIIATSSRYLSSSQELAPFLEKCRVIPLGIDFVSSNANGNALHELHGLLGNPLILAIGRLVPYKGFDVLIRAMRDVNATLILIGNGPQATWLKKLANREGLTERIRMLGRVGDLEPYFRAASIFVLPSTTRAEAFGLVQVEAMAAGLPVVNTYINSGVPEVSVNGETGVTVEPGNANALAEAIQFLLDNKDLRERFSEAARARAHKEYSADLMAERTSELYRELLK